MRMRARMLAVAMATVLVATACGGDDGTQGATAETVDEGVKQGLDEAFNASTTTAGSSASLPETLEEWEELWAAERDGIVKKIKDNKWGKSADGKTLNGPDGFTIDLSKCPAGWSDTEGVTDDRIRIGHTTALSGPAGDYGNIGRAVDVILAYYSDQGAFVDGAGNRRRVEFIMKDDGYDPARTIPLVDELIDSEKVFAMWTLGAGMGLKTYDKLNQRCIPHPFEMSGHPAWGDPVKHPWTTGLQMAYNTEAALWGQFIEQRLDEFPDGVKVGSLVVSADFGRAYDQAFQAYLQQSPHKDKIEYFNEVVEITAPNVKDQMTTIASKQPDIFITMTGGSQCPQIIQEAAENGLKDSAKYLFMSSVCKAASFVGKDKVGGDGSASNGWWIMGSGVRDFNSPAEDDDPYIQWGRELLRSNGIDYKQSGSFGSGFLFAFPMVQALRTAGQLDGGLTRSNFILVQRSMEMTNPMLLPGVKFNMSGNRDAYFVEGSDISQYDSAKQEWVQQGPTVDLSGKSKPCAFDSATSSCR